MIEDILLNTFWTEVRIENYLSFDVRLIRFSAASKARYFNYVLFQKQGG